MNTHNDPDAQHDTIIVFLDTLQKHKNNNNVFISTTNKIEKLLSKKHKTNNKIKSNKPKDKNQIKTTKYTNQKINIAYYTKTNKPKHQMSNLILKTIQRILTKQINIILNNTPTKTQMTNIQIKTKTKPITNHALSNNQTNNNTISQNTKHNQKIPYTPGNDEQHTILHNKMGSAYRPRHKFKTKYKLINNWTPNTITNHIHTSNKNTHFPTKQLATTISALPNLFSNTKFKLTKYLKTYKRKPKICQLHGYYFINKLTLLQCGDIETNPGPMPDILRTHPATHKRRAKIYFIPNTIKLQPEYQHIASTFAPILRQNHPLHQQMTTTHPHLHQYIQTQNYSPPTHILYALVITIHPALDTCNHILAQPHTYHFNDIWTNTLIIRLANLNNPPERHILTQHPYTTFVENNQDIINPKNSIHTVLYEFIHNQDIPTTPIAIQRKFPFLPEK